MPGNHNEVEKRLWEAADELRANSKLKSSEYSIPVLGLIFLRFADHRFALATSELSVGSARYTPGKLDYQARGVLYLPEQSRFSYLLNLPEGSDIGASINEAMRAIEAENEDLRGVLPTTYQGISKEILFNLLKTFAAIPMDIEGDAFGKIYEYFLGKFAMAEGQKGGEFFTPTAIVKLIVEILEPFHGRLLDPASGSGGMFVQSARFVAEHRCDPGKEIAIYGQEKVAEYIRLCKMNLAVHGLSGDIRQGNTYYEDLHDSVGRFDFVMANPPFNVDKVDKEKLRDDPRYPFGLPHRDNANYLWISLFYSSLNEWGRAGFVMANSASDARSSELEIRRQFIQVGAVDVMVSIGSNFFNTVTLPCTLWFLDRGKRTGDRRDKVLFLDTRSIFRQIDRAHRDFTPEQIDLLAGIVRLYRGEDANGYIFRAEGSNLTKAQATILEEAFRTRQYRDVPGLCKVVALSEIETQDWSLNPGRYVGLAEQQEDGIDFYQRLEELNEELERLNSEAHELEERIAENMIKLLEEE